MSPALRVQLLGDFHVVLDDGPVEAVLSSRLQALLAYLILQRGKPQLRQHLAFVLWPDSAEGQARTNLRHLLHTLRHTLPAADEYLRAEPLTLEWRAQPLSSDVAEFEQALFEGNFQRAAALYRNDLLPSCYDDWIVPERERLRQEFIQALEQLILLHEKNQEYSEAIVYGQRALQ